MWTAFGGCSTQLKVETVCSACIQSASDSIRTEVGEVLVRQEGKHTLNDYWNEFTEKSHKLFNSTVKWVSWRFSAISNHCTQLIFHHNISYFGLLSSAKQTQDRMCINCFYATLLINPRNLSSDLAPASGSFCCKNNTTMPFFKDYNWRDCFTMLQTEAVLRFCCIKFNW